MPWHIDGLCVYKDGETEPIKCHETEQEAKDHLAALYANAPDEEKAVKAGARNSAGDLERLQSIHDLSVENGASCKPSGDPAPFAGKTPIESASAEQVDVDADKTVISYGGAVKALPDNRIGGYLVTYGGLDLTGEYFTADTDFGEAERLPVLYHHGLDETLKRRRLGTAELRHDPVGIWAETQLQMRDEYEKMIYQLAQEGKLGWSSGTASHVVEKAQEEKGAHIKQWFFAEASLTPAPAEPHNSVIPLKSLMTGDKNTAKAEGVPEAVKPAAGEAGAEVKSIPSQGVKTMEITPEIKELMDASAKAAVQAFAESAPAKTAPVNVEVVKDEGDQPWKSAGEFLKAVKVAGERPNVVDPRLMKASGLNEEIPSQGGFLVPDQIASGIIEKMHPTGSLLSKLSPVTVSGNSMTFNVNDESSRAEGYRWGGIRGYWLEEGGTKTDSKPTFRQTSLKLHKVAALCYATDELLEDADALQSWLGRIVPLELKFKVEEAVFLGDGVGKPLGITTSPALITCLRRTLLTIDAIDLMTMWSRRYVGVNDYVWLVSPSVYPAFGAMTLGNFPVWLPNNSVAGQNTLGTIFGAPIIETEYNATLGTVNDVVLFSPSQYLCITKGGIQAASSIHVKFTTDESTFRWVYRFDGCPAWMTTLTGYDAATYSPYVVLATTTA